MKQARIIDSPLKATRAIFRPLQPQDHADVEEMALALYEEDAAGKPMTRAKIQKTIHHLTDHPDKGRIVIFCIDQEVAGYAILLFYWSNEYGGELICIDELYIKPTWRSRGIATRFFAHLDAVFGGAAKAFQLEVTPENDRGLQFYRRLGFTPAPNVHLLKEL